MKLRPVLGDVDAFAVRGRVIAVHPLMSGGFQVVLGPPPDLFAFDVKAKPPRVGERVTLRGRLLSSERIEAGSSVGTLGTIASTSWSVDPDEYPTRVVSATWLERVQRVMTRPLYRYQIEGAGWLASRIAAGKGALLCDDTGLGKTGQMIAALCAVRAFPAIIVCPGTLKIQWQREFQHAVSPPVVQIVDGFYGGIELGQVHILNYDLLRAREAQIALMRPAVIVFDEVQALKNPKAGKDHRASIGTRLAEKTRSVIGLTGTPIMNRPNEYWRLLHLVDKEAWPSYRAFARAYCGARRKKDEEDELETPIGRVVSTSVGRIQRIDELNARSGPYVLRRLKSQVLKDLPPKSRRSILVHVEERLLVHYRAAEKSVVDWLRAMGYGSRAAKAEKAEALTKLTYLRHIVALCKLESAVPEYLSRWFDRSQLEPLVVFAYHRDVMAGLVQIGQRLNLRISGIGGGESPERKQAQVDRFQNGEADVFFAPIRAAGVGLNLQRASEALFCERIFTPSAMTQAEDRIHRIGTTRPVTITYLDAAGTVDEHLADILTSKQQLIRATLDERGDEVTETIETVESLANRLVARVSA